MCTRISYYYERIQHCILSTWAACVLTTILMMKHLHMRKNVCQRMSTTAYTLHHILSLISKHTFYTCTRISYYYYYERIQHCILSTWAACVLTTILMMQHLYMRKCMSTTAYTLHHILSLVSKHTFYTCTRISYMREHMGCMCSNYDNIDDATSIYM